MLFVNFQFKISPEKYNIIFGHVGVMLKGQFKGFNLIRMEPEQGSKELAKLTIVADPAAPHLQN